MTIASVIASDLAFFFNKDEFAVEATLSTGTKINVIFDSTPEMALGIENADLSIMAKYSDVSTLVVGSVLVINSVSYGVLRTEPNSHTGISVLKLTRLSGEIIYGEDGTPIWLEDRTPLVGA